MGSSEPGRSQTARETASKGEASSHGKQNIRASQVKRETAEQGEPDIWGNSILGRKETNMGSQDEAVTVAAVAGGHV